MASDRREQAEMQGNCMISWGIVFRGFSKLYRRRELNQIFKPQKSINNSNDILIWRFAGTSSWFLVFSSCWRNSIA